MMGITQRILEARSRHLLAGHSMPTRVRLPAGDAESFRAWVDRIESDPWAPCDSGLKRQFAGMVVCEDAALSEIVIE